MTQGESRFWRLFEGIRRIVVFLLGVVVIIFALVDPESSNTVVMLSIGMVMVGILPIENLFGIWGSNRRSSGRRNE